MRWLLAILLPLLLSWNYKFYKQTIELVTNEFIFCSYKTAKVIKARVLRVQKFPDIKKCAVISSALGKDTILYQNPWLSLCKKQAQKIQLNLEADLWSCKKFKNNLMILSFSKTH